LKEHEGIGTKDEERRKTKDDGVKSRILHTYSA